jgi:hypothetical protein
MSSSLHEAAAVQEKETSMEITREQTLFSSRKSSYARNPNHHFKIHISKAIREYSPLIDRADQKVSA